MNGTRRLLQYQPPKTVPIERAEKPAVPLTPDTACGWCGIKTAAIPDEPVLIGARWFHPTETCLHAAWRRRVIATHPTVRATP